MILSSHFKTSEGRDTQTKSCPHPIGPPTGVKLLEFITLTLLYLQLFPYGDKPLWHLWGEK